MQPKFVIWALWIGWLISWLIAARWSYPTQARLKIATQLRSRAAIVMGVALLAAFALSPYGQLHLWDVGRTGAWICVVGVAIGIAFAWWARVDLGPLWSSWVTRKADHRVVDTGPYAVVRHPIYSGMLFAALSTAAAMGTALGVAGFALIVLGFVLKARLEEHWLARELPEDAYSRYRTRVPMLIPLCRRGKSRPRDVD